MATKKRKPKNAPPNIKMGGGKKPVRMMRDAEMEAAMKSMPMMKKPAVPKRRRTGSRKPR